MAELLNDAAAGSNLNPFAFIASKAKPGASIAEFAIASGAMAAGVTGKVVSVDYEEITGGNAPLLTGDQIVRDAEGKEYIIQKHLGPDGKPNRRKAPTIRFDNGRTMTLGLFLQGQSKTTVALRVGGAVQTVKATDFVMSGEGVNNIFNLVGRTLKCENTWKDKDIKITRNNPGQAPVEYDANVYVFVEV